MTSLYSCEDEEVLKEIQKLLSRDFSVLHSGIGVSDMDAASDDDTELLERSECDSDEYKVCDSDDESDDESISSNNSEIIEEINIDPDTHLLLHRPTKILGEGVYHLHPWYEPIINPIRSDCDCVEGFGLSVCMRESDPPYMFCADVVDLGEDALKIAVEECKEYDRRPNNEMRKQLYRLIFHSLDFHAVEKGERRQLPNCALARVRQLYPSHTGHYMGFKAEQKCNIDKTPQKSNHKRKKFV
jgi:hypothetical protein